MLDPKNVLPGQSQHEKFKSRVNKKVYVAYDYRDHDGKLFSCTGATLNDCERKRDKWLSVKEKPQAATRS